MAGINPIYDRTSELKAFDDTKAGVKGLVDAGITEIPRMFMQEPDEFEVSADKQLCFPIIDLENVDKDPVRRNAVVDEVRYSSEDWGFFGLVNHGIPTSVMAEMLDGVRKFYEQDTDAKKAWYTRDVTKKVLYNSNFDLYAAPAANWRDSLYCRLYPNPPSPEEIPEAIRYVCYEMDIIWTYDAHLGRQILCTVMTRHWHVEFN